MAVSNIRENNNWKRIVATSRLRTASSLTEDLLDMLDNETLMGERSITPAMDAMIGEAHEAMQLVQDKVAHAVLHMRELNKEQG